MHRADLSARISVNPERLHGEPAIRGTRIAVSQILGLLEVGESWQAILTDYPGLSREDIRAALHYAAGVVGQVEVSPREVVPSSA